MAFRPVIALLLLCCPTGAAAGERARDLLDQARLRMTTADFAGALTLLGRAKRATDPEVAGGGELAAQIELQLGVVYAVLGRTEDARSAFTTALRHDASVRVDPAKVKRSILELFTDTRNGLWGELSITADVPEVELWIDGRPSGRLPFRGRLVVGPHELRAVLLGQQVEARTVIVPVDQALAVQLPLRQRCATLVVRGERDGAEVFFDGRPLGSAPLTRFVPEGEHELVVDAGRRRRRHALTLEAGATVSVAAGDARPISRPVRARPRGRRLWTWIALGGAGVSFAVALGFGATAREDYRDYQALPADQGVRGREVEAQVRDNATRANVLFGVAGALLATSAVLFFVEGRTAAAPRSRVSIGPALGDVYGIRAHARF